MYCTTKVEKAVIPVGFKRGSIAMGILGEVFPSIGRSSR